MEQHLLTRRKFTSDVYPIMIYGGTDYLDVPFVGMPCIDGDILANDWEEVER